MLPSVAAYSLVYGAYAVLVLFEPPAVWDGDWARLLLTKGMVVIVDGPSFKDVVENATTADSACNDSGCARCLGLAVAFSSSVIELYLGSPYSALMALGISCVGAGRFGSSEVIPFFGLAMGVLKSVVSV